MDQFIQAKVQYEVSSSNNKPPNASFSTLEYDGETFKGLRGYFKPTAVQVLFPGTKSLKHIILNTFKILTYPNCSQVFISTILSNASSNNRVLNRLKHTNG